MGMGVYEKNNRVYIDFYYQNVRCREPLRIPYTKPNIKYAERLHGEILNKIATGTFIYSDYFPNSKKCLMFGCRYAVNMSFKELYDQWIEIAEKRFRAGLITRSTLKNYKSDIKEFLKQFQDFNVKSITKADVEDFIVESSISKKPKTINNALTTLAQIFQYAVDKEYIEINTIKKVKRLKVKRAEIYPFSQNQMFDVLDKLEGTIAYSIIATMFYTGIRTGEALAMKWENLNTSSWTYHIKESFSNKRLAPPKTPGSIRVVTLSEPVQKIIKAQKAVSFLRSEFIFINKRGNPYKTTNGPLMDEWTKALACLELDFRIPYQCRHTFAILSLKVGDDPENVAKQLGHTTLERLFNNYARFLKDTDRTESKFAEMVTKRSLEKNTENQTPDITDNLD